jgi:hypothetical protein
MSCSSSKVITDYDTKINFNDFVFFDFYEDVGKGLNEFDVKRVTEALKVELTKKGIRQNETPDFYINVISTISEAQNNNTIGIGIGGNNGGLGIPGGIPIGGKKLNEELIIEFVNSKTNSIIWEGILNSTIKEKRKPEEKVIHFQKIAKKILEKYPPE